VSIIRPAPCPRERAARLREAIFAHFAGRRGQETVEQTPEVGPALLRLDLLPLEPFHPAIHGGRDLDARHDRTHDSLRRARDQAPAPRRERRYDGDERGTRMAHSTCFRRADRGYNGPFRRNLTEHPISDLQHPFALL
jgi:hypothetical protein